MNFLNLSQNISNSLGLSHRFGDVAKHSRRFIAGCAPWFFLLVHQSGYSDIEKQYLAAKPNDPVTAMVARINSGQLKLKYEPAQGYLRAILHQLDISSTSQILVFSKTSIQAAYISPNTPRALYFNDRAYIGWIRGAPNIELAGIDPQVGPIFYTLVNDQSQTPRFVRQTDECLPCHSTSMTEHVPGLLARSVYAGPDGTPRLAGGSFVTKATSPMKERWGGWYVTGTHGEQRHMGNEVARGSDLDPVIDTEKGANVTDLNRYFNVDTYLTPHSDIEALMVAEQQMGIQNLITKARFLTRKALDEGKELGKFGFTEEHVASTTNERLKDACEPLVLALTGASEPKLDSPIAGISRFAATFSLTSPADKKSRRLSQLNLKTRLLEFPCSPMIYSQAFKALPVEAKAFVATRLIQILSGEDASQPYAKLEPAARQAALEILRDTLPSEGYN